MSWNRISTTPFYARRKPRIEGTQNLGRPAENDRAGTHPPFLRPRARHGDPAYLARRPIRRRPAGRERLLLRRRTQPPHLARGLSQDRGGDEKGNQGQP